MLSMIKLISIDKPNNFVSTLILNLTGKKNDGLNYGPDKIQILLVTESQEKRKIKETISDIWKWKWDHSLHYILTKNIFNAINNRFKPNSTSFII